VTEKRNRANGGSAMTVSFRTIVVFTLCLLSS
jgi:hypothetical protein